ncbi:MAG TPA: SelB C-terminal domain-containing protein, partial [Gemmatimonadales bacterium]|nr:SelB C-terminal domain-containing protein [Gemmatimonadales bacterium]
ATGVDLALLVVAADEGVMPQTTEHLAILRFLGVTRGVVALTKCDLATDEAWRALVADDVREKVAAAFGRAWPVVEVSAVTGAGIDALKAALAEEGRALAVRPAGDRFRMPVDRAFALPGAGTIVTGTVWSGTASEGDRLVLLPSGLEARVRSIEVHGRAAKQAVPGRRTALALVGPPHEKVARGEVVVSGEGWRASRALDVSLAMLPQSPVKLKPRLRVRVNHGTAEVLARVAPAAGAQAGDGVPARLVLESPLVARAGDRFVVRSYSPVTTIGGGTVVDPWADDRALARARGAYPAPPDSDAALVALLVSRRGERGLARAELEAAAGLDAARFAAACDAARASGILEVEGRLFAEAVAAEVAERLADALMRFHAGHPLEAGMPAQSWRAAAGAAPAVLVDVAAQRLVDLQLVAREGALVRRSDWAPKIGGATERLRADLLRELTEADAEPPSVAELAARHPGADVAGLLRLMAREGVVAAVGKDRFYEAGALARERDRIVTIVGNEAAATPAVIRERLGRSRKWLIPFLEWCDAQGITVRRGDGRVLGNRPRA